MIYNCYEFPLISTPRSYLYLPCRTLVIFIQVALQNFRACPSLCLWTSKNQHRRMHDKILTSGKLEKAEVSPVPGTPALKTSPGRSAGPLGGAGESAVSARSSFYTYSFRIHSNMSMTWREVVRRMLQPAVTLPALTIVCSSASVVCSSALEPPTSSVRGTVVIRRPGQFPAGVPSRRSKVPPPFEPNSRAVEFDSAVRNVMLRKRMAPLTSYLPPRVARRDCGHKFVQPQPSRKQIPYVRWHVTGSTKKRTESPSVSV